MTSKKSSRPVPGPGLRWRGSVIWMRSCRADNPFNESTGTALVREARTIYAERLARPADPDRKKVAAPVRKLNIRDLREWHLRATHRRSPGHRRGVEYAWDTGLVPYFVERDITRLRPDDLLDYVIYRVDDEGVSGNTVQREVQFLRRALRHQAEHRELPIRVPPKPDAVEFELHLVNAGQAGGHLEDDVLVGLYQHGTPACRRWLLMLLATGMRQEELRRVTPAMLRPAPLLVPSGGVLALPAWATKTRRARTLSLPDWAYRAFLGGPLPFTYNSYKVLRSAASHLCLPDGVFPHDRSLRKTFASRAREETHDPDAVDIAMGHKARGTSGRYQDLTEYRAYEVGRAISFRFRAFLEAVGLPADPWPSLEDWASHRAARLSNPPKSARPNITSRNSVTGRPKDNVP